MLKIGEFAQLAQVSVKTLRHYEKIGLLKPIKIDPENGYRFYAMDQLSVMMRILALKDCGFALDEIAPLLGSYDNQTVVNLLAKRIADQRQILGTEQERLQRLIGRRQQLMEGSDLPDYDVVIKRTEAMTLIGQRQKLENPATIPDFVGVVLGALVATSIVPVGPLVHLYFAIDEATGAMDIFVGSAVMALPSSLGELCCQRLEANTLVACVLHTGSYTTIRNAYAALDLWSQHSGHQRTGPPREVYHRTPAETANPSEYLTELQFPIMHHREKE